MIFTLFVHHETIQLKFKDKIIGQNLRSRNENKGSATAGMANRG